MIRIISLSVIALLTISGVSAQMGGMGAPPAQEIPEVEGETWIWKVPTKWYPYTKNSDVKNDVYIFPTGQKPDNWKQMLQFEQFNSTLGITDVKQVFELKSKKPENCSAYTVETLKEQQEKAYSTHLWVDRCTADGTTMVTLRKATLGIDRLYLASKIWKSEPKAKEMEKWLAFLGQSYVCDGTPEHDCRPPRPEGGRPGGR